MRWSNVGAPRSLLAFGGIVLAWGCTRPPPTEVLLVVREAEAPGLASPTKKQGGALRNPHLGDVFLPMQNWGRKSWKSTEGEPISREGDLLQVQRTPQEGFAFIFAEDLVQAAVPTATWLCSTSPHPISLASLPCPQILSRIWIDAETTVAFAPCQAGQCPLGIARKGRVNWGQSADLLAVQQRRFAGHSWLVVTRALNEGKRTGLQWGFVLVDEGPKEVAKVAFEEVDTSAYPTVRNLTLTPQFRDDAVVLSGNERAQDAVSGRELWVKPAVREVRFSGKTLTITPG